MRARDFLIENKGNGIRFVALEDATDIIKTQCQPWMKATDNGAYFVFRGTNSFNADGYAFIKPTRLDRKPRDTSKVYHTIFNSILDISGSIANRNNSIFCSGDPQVSKTYGSNYVVFPIGEFHYTWSPVWEDWTVDLSLREISNLIKTKDPKKFIDAEDDPDEQLKYLINFVDDANNYDMDALHKALKVDTGLIDAIRSGTEIMIHCSSALYVDSEAYFNNMSDEGL